MSVLGVLSVLLLLAAVEAATLFKRQATQPHATPSQLFKRNCLNAAV